MTDANKAKPTPTVDYTRPSGKLITVTNTKHNLAYAKRQGWKIEVKAKAEKG